MDAYIGEKYTWGNIFSCRMGKSIGMASASAYSKAYHPAQPGTKRNKPHFFTLSLLEPELARPQPLPGLHDEMWKRIASSVAEYQVCERRRSIYILIGFPPFPACLGLGGLFFTSSFPGSRSGLCTMKCVGGSARLTRVDGSGGMRGIG